MAITRLPSSSVAGLTLPTQPTVAPQMATETAGATGVSFVNSFTSPTSSALSTPSSSSSSGGSSEDKMKQMNMAFIFQNLQTMRDKAAADQKEAMKKGDPGAV